MGWSIGFDSNWNRDMGYGVPAKCDHPDCDKDIDRGLAFVCGSDPFGGEHGCGLYFCSDHLYFEEIDDRLIQLCEKCSKKDYDNPFIPKPDTQEWIDWKMTDPSWEEWRKENPEWVTKHKKVK